MKITKETLKQIIKEEIQTVLNEEKRELPPEHPGKETHAENLRKAKDPNITAKQLVTMIELPAGFDTINDYFKFNDPLKGGNMKLRRAIRLAMTNPAAFNIHRKKM